MSLLPCVEIGPPDADRVIIWLHGLGADGHDFAPLVPELGLPDNVRFVFPHAPERPVTVNAGVVMRAWYDIPALDFNLNEDEAGIQQSQSQLEALIENEIARGVAGEHILLAGFSQGGAIALHTGLRHVGKLAGILALSTYVPLAASLEAEARQENRDLAIFLAHGSQDPVIPLWLAQDSKHFLEQHGYAPQWHTYNMAHSVHPDEIRDMSAWIREVLALT